FLADAVLMEVAVCGQRECSRSSVTRPDYARGCSGQARISRILQLLESRNQDQVIGAGGDGKCGIAQRILSGGAHVLDTGHGNVLELERTGQRQARHSRGQRAHPTSLYLIGLDSGIFKSFITGFDDQIVGTFIPVLTELGASHSYYRDAVAEIL